MPVKSRLGVELSASLRLLLGKAPRAQAPLRRAPWLCLLLTFLESAYMNTLHFQKFKNTHLELQMIKHESQVIRGWQDCADLEVLRDHVPGDLTSAKSGRWSASLLGLCGQSVRQCVFTACESIPSRKKKKKPTHHADQPDLPLLKSLILQYLSTFSAEKVKQGKQKIKSHTNSFEPNSFPF